MSLHLLRLIIERLWLRRKKMRRNKVDRRKSKKMEEGRNILCGEEDGTAYTTISA